jgi:hypothetical protein
MKKRNTVEGFALSDLDTYEKATVIQTVWFCHKEQVSGAK